MTSRDIYEFTLIELNKLEAPSLLIEDFNYLLNKAIQQYINLVYSKSEIDQQSTDDIRVLKATSVLVPEKFDKYRPELGTEGMLSSSWYVKLPSDYMHLLNCIVEYEASNNKGCIKEGSQVYYTARRLTSDMFSSIIGNAYMKPSYKRPYYYLNYTNNKTEWGNKGEDLESSIENTLEELKNPFIYATEEKGSRCSNSQDVLMELRLGDSSLYVPKHIYVDYIKSPMHIHLTQDQIDDTVDNSQTVEFPDYVCFEIINILVRLVMENASDPRLQTVIPINNTISNTMQQAYAQQSIQKS